ncbi:MAG: hypothetical protein HYZ87_00400, partial [Candidatus Omnitrophica bacterium]|nr:hypothetical protein [Candidatus Omnitrophota bacterium]
EKIAQGGALGIAHNLWGAALDQTVELADRSGFGGYLSRGLGVDYFSEDRAAIREATRDMRRVTRMLTEDLEKIGLNPAVTNFETLFRSLDLHSRKTYEESLGRLEKQKAFASISKPQWEALRSKYPLFRFYTNSTGELEGLYLKKSIREKREEAEALGPRVEAAERRFMNAKTPKEIRESSFALQEVRLEQRLGFAEADYAEAELKFNQSIEGLSEPAQRLVFMLVRMGADKVFGENNRENFDKKFKSYSQIMFMSGMDPLRAALDFQRGEKGLSETQLGLIFSRRADFDRFAETAGELREAKEESRLFEKARRSKVPGRVLERELGATELYKKYPDADFRPIWDIFGRFGKGLSTLRETRTKLLKIKEGEAEFTRLVKDKDEKSAQALLNDPKYAEVKSALAPIFVQAVKPVVGPPAPPAPVREEVAKPAEAKPTAKTPASAPPAPPVIQRVTPDKPAVKVEPTPPVQLELQEPVVGISTRLLDISNRFAQSQDSETRALGAVALTLYKNKTVTLSTFREAIAGNEAFKSPAEREKALDRILSAVTDVNPEVIKVVFEIASGFDKQFAENDLEVAQVLNPRALTAIFKKLAGLNPTADQKRILELVSDIATLYVEKAARAESFDLHAFVMASGNVKQAEGRFLEARTKLEAELGKDWIDILINPALSGELGLDAEGRLTAGLGVSTQLNVAKKTAAVTLVKEYFTALMDYENAVAREKTAYFLPYLHLAKMKQGASGEVRAQLTAIEGRFPAGVPEGQWVRWRIRLIEAMPKAYEESARNSMKEVFGEKFDDAMVSQIPSGAPEISKWLGAQLDQATPRNEVLNLAGALSDKEKRLFEGLHGAMSVGFHMSSFNDLMELLGFIRVGYTFYDNYDSFSSKLSQLEIQRFKAVLDSGKRKLTLAIAAKDAEIKRLLEVIRIETPEAPTAMDSLAAARDYFNSVEKSAPALRELYTRYHFKGRGYDGLFAAITEKARLEAQSKSLDRAVRALEESHKEATPKEKAELEKSHSEFDRESGVLSKRTKAASTLTDIRGVLRDIQDLRRFRPDFSGKMTRYETRTGRLFLRAQLQAIKIVETKAELSEETAEAFDRVLTEIASQNLLLNPKDRASLYADWVKALDALAARSHAKDDARVRKMREELDGHFKVNAEQEKFLKLVADTRQGMGKITTLSDWNEAVQRVDKERRRVAQYFTGKKAKGFDKAVAEMRSAAETKALEIIRGSGLSLEKLGSFEQLLAVFDYGRLEIKDQRVKREDWLRAIRQAASSSKDIKTRQALEGAVDAAFKDVKRHDTIRVDLIQNSNEILDKDIDQLPFAKKTASIMVILEDINKVEKEGLPGFGKEAIRLSRDIFDLRLKAEKKAAEVLITEVRAKKALTPEAAEAMMRVIGLMGYDRMIPDEQEDAMERWGKVIEQMIDADPALKAAKKDILPFLPSKSSVLRPARNSFALWQMLTAMQSKFEATERATLIGKITLNLYVPFLDIVQREMLNAKTPLSEATYESFEQFMGALKLWRLDPLRLKQFRSEIESSLVQMARRNGALKSRVLDAEKYFKERNISPTPRQILDHLTGAEDAAVPQLKLLDRFVFTLDRTFKVAEMERAVKEGAKPEETVDRAARVIGAVRETETLVADFERAAGRVDKLTIDEIVKGEFFNDLRRRMLLATVSIQRLPFALIQDFDQSRLDTLKNLEKRTSDAAESVKRALLEKLRFAGVEDQQKLLAYWAVDEVSPDKLNRDLGSPYALTAKEIEDKYRDLIRLVQSGKLGPKEKADRVAQINRDQKAANDVRRKIVSYRLDRLAQAVSPRYVRHAESYEELESTANGLIQEARLLGISKPGYEQVLTRITEAKAQAQKDKKDFSRYLTAVEGDFVSATSQTELNELWQELARETVRNLSLYPLVKGERDALIQRVMKIHERYSLALVRTSFVFTAGRS